MTKQGRADKSNNVSVGVGLESDMLPRSPAPYGSRPSDGRKREPNTRAVNPGGVGQLGNMQGSHVTSHDDTSYRGDDFFIGRGYRSPPIKSKSRNNGSQGRY